MLYFLVILWASLFFTKQEILVTAGVTSLFSLLPFLYDTAAVASNQGTDELVQPFLIFLMGWAANLLSRQKEEAYLKEKANSAQKARFAIQMETLQRINKELSAELELDRLLRLTLSEGIKLLDFEVGGFCFGMWNRTHLS